MVMTSANSVFSSWMSGGSRLTRVAKRVALIVVLLYVSIGAWFAFRAVDQVRQLDLRVVSATLRPGIPGFVSVVTSGLTPVEVRLDLIQGTRTSTLANLRISASRRPFYDPRRRQGSMMPSFTTEFLAPFTPGAALLRATAVGHRVWFYTPPPTVQEIPVFVAPAAP
jgi:hypothetical protein